MFTLETIEGELFDEESSTFITVPRITIQLEHSLLSLSKWESKYNKPFMGKEEKSRDEILNYIHMMVLTPDVDINMIGSLSNDDIRAISAYIDSPQSATTFNTMHDDNKPNREIITSEIIYYWMVSFKIPFECETWHLNRLLTLIRVCNIKNSKQKKMPRHTTARNNRMLNAQRRAKFNTSG